MRALEAGEFRDYVTLQRVTESANAIGTAGTAAWANLATAPSVWALIEPLTGREALTGDRVQAEATHRIRIRHRTDLRAKDRVTLGSRTFGIVSVLVDAVWHRETHLLCRELIT